MSFFRRIITAFLVAFLLAGASLSALAEEVQPDTDAAFAAERGRQALLDTGHATFLTFPEEESYLAEWKTLYARKAFHAPCLEVKRAPDSTSANMTYLYEGTAVTVVAEQEEMSCILYRGSNNKQYCGWIKSIRLLEDFPGLTLVSGEPRAESDPAAVAPEISWGEIGYQKFWHPFSLLSEPVRNCVGFTLEYQLIVENTTKWERIYGPREIWINTGEQWEQAGIFSYPEKGAVKVSVWLEEPKDIFAVGTIAQCQEPYLFDFRQTAYDFRVAKS